MASKWDHPKFGSFKHDGVEWSGKVEAPAFAAFKWDTGYPGTRRPPRKFDFGFESHDEDDVPTKAMIAVAQKVLAAQKDLVPKVTAALWEEFNGRGGDSGMWWRGDREQLLLSLEESGMPEPKSADDILGLMQLSAITVRPGVDGYDKPVVELTFHAAFEEEHGVGVLTDGEKILGTGYSVDVTPYKSPRKPKKRPTRK